MTNTTLVLNYLALASKDYLPLERFMFVLDMPKKKTLRNFRHVLRCTHTITCFIWQSLN